MVLPFIVAAGRVSKKAAKAGYRVAKGGYKVAKKTHEIATSDQAKGAYRETAKKAKQARCAVKAARAKPGQKRKVYRSCITGKPIKKGRR